MQYIPCGLRWVLGQEVTAWHCPLHEGRQGPEIGSHSGLGTPATAATHEGNVLLNDRKEGSIMTSKVCMHVQVAFTCTACTAGHFIVSCEIHMPAHTTGRLEMIACRLLLSSSVASSWSDPCCWQPASRQIGPARCFRQNTSCLPGSLALLESVVTACCSVSSNWVCLCFTSSMHAFMVRLLTTRLSCRA